MKLLLLLAWRNIWRNKRRSILTLGAIAFATTLTILSRGLGEGTWNVNVRNAVEMISGFIVLQHPDYADNPSLTRSLRNSAALRNMVAQEPSVTKVAPRIQANGLVSFRSHSMGAMILGIDPDAERGFSRFEARTIEGQFIPDSAFEEIVVGYKLLENLNGSIGDEIVILAQGYDGVLGNLRFRVVGTVKMGILEFDANAVLMHLDAAQDLLAMYGRVTKIVANIDDTSILPSLRDRLDERVRAAGLSDVAVLTWEQDLPELKQAMEFDLIGNWIFLGILILIIAFGILNTILMSITERFREFGVTLALGMKSMRLVRLVGIETLYLTLIGGSAGAVMGQLVNSYVKNNPIPLSGDVEAIYAEYGFLPFIYATDSLTIVLVTALIIGLVTLTVAIYPARKVAHLEPLKGIRET